MPPKDATSTTTYTDRLEKAKTILKKAGWTTNSDGVLEKKKSKKETVRLEFSLSTSNLPDLVQTAQLLKENWEQLGARVNVKVYEIGDLEENVIRPRKYDCLLFGEIMGRDPDPFAFWHSSQRNDPGLNIALYANKTADKLMEEARSLGDTSQKEEKYRRLQEEIIKDNAAIFLYSPNFIYLLPDQLKGVNAASIITPPERFSDVYNWYLRTERVWKIFSRD